MVMMVNADISALLDAIAAADVDAVIRETVQLLGPEKVPPAKVAARVGIPVAWAGGDGHPLATLSVTGRIAEWMRSMPIGPEPGAESRRALASALPLVQGFLATADNVRRGLPEPHPDLPEPIVPADVNHSGGAVGALKAAVANHDLQRSRAILMGLYATGTDYRALLTAMYAALDLRYPEGGHPLSFVVAGSRLLDMASWGDRMPAFIFWATPLMLDTAPDAPAAEAARAYMSAPEHDLGWLRTRLSIPKDEAAGPGFQRALVAGDGTAACEAVLQALRDGATPMGVAAGISVAAAEQVNAVAPGDREGLLRAAHALLYAHSVHAAMLHTQNEAVWPLLYTAACAVNSVGSAAGAPTADRALPNVPSSPLGGLIPASMLRTVEQQIVEGDTSSALASARRYLQMGHPPRALAGVVGAAASTRDIQPGEAQSLHILPLVAAAAEEYLNLPRALQQNGQMPLLAAAIRLCGELGRAHTLADRVRGVVEQQV